MFTTRERENQPLNHEDSDESQYEDDDEDELTRIIPPTVQDTQQRLKARYILGILGFFGFANVYAMRVNLSVAIVAMVNNSAIPQVNTSVLDVCPPVESINTTIPVSDGEFDWNEKTQGIVLGSFFYGYVLTQVPGGRLAELYGGKRVFGIGVLMTALFTLLSPVAAYINFPLFIAVRILEGMGEGVTFPAMHAMLARWIPPLERSKFAAIVYAGANFGTVVSLPVSGWLCSLDFWNGWPLCFYLFGGLGLIWFVFWLFLVYDTPSVHPRICPQEKAYIIECIEPSASARQRLFNDGDGDDNDLEDIHIEIERSIPWKKMFTCVPLWAILVTQCGQSWAFYTQLTELPTYMNNILHFDIQQNAMLSALPYLSSWWLGIFISIFADWLLSRGYLSLATSYKLFNSIGSVIPSLGLLGVAWVGCDRTVVQLMLTIPGAFAGAVYAGNQMNHIALSPKYAGTMYGITNAAANMCGFLAPYVVGLLVAGRETLGQWRVVFYLAAGINIGANLFYVAFASAREQPWSRSEHRQIEPHIN